MKSATAVVTRIVVAFSAPLGDAIRSSEQLMAPQLDAGCKGHRAPGPKRREKPASAAK